MAETVPETQGPSTISQDTGFSPKAIKRARFIIGIVSLCIAPFVAILPDDLSRYVGAALLGINGVAHMLGGS